MCQLLDNIRALSLLFNIRWFMVYLWEAKQTLTLNTRTKKKKPFNPNRIEYEKFECEKK